MTGLLVYFVLVVVSLLTGQAVLRWVAPRLDDRAALYLAPIVTLAVWTFVVALAVVSGVPLKRAWVAGWALTAVLLSIGAYRFKYSAVGRAEAPVVIVGSLLPVALMAPYFRHGVQDYLGSHLHDGWSYIVYGQYLWEHARGAEGGLAPLYQYAAHLNGTRFVASGLLAFFSPLTGFLGETQAASGYLLAWAFFVFVFACLFLGVVHGLGRGRLIAFAAMAGFSGQLLNLLWANNFDNALALGYLPALAGVVALVDPRQWRWGLLLGGLAGGIVYCYPEMATVTLAAVGLLLLERAWREPAAIGAWLLLVLTSGVTAAIVVAPFAREGAAFVVNQLSSATAQGTARPGEGFFSELLRPNRWIAAWWGLGPEEFIASPWVRKSLHRAGTLVGPLLGAAALIGLMDLVRRRQVALAVSISALAGAAALLALRSRYSYGAYKFILINWWGMCLAVVAGVDALLRTRALGRYCRALTALVVGLLVLYIAANAARVASFDATLGRNSVTPFKRVREIGRIVGREPLVVAVDDDIANEWAVYFLREFRIHLAEYRAYMAQAHVVPLMERAAPVDLGAVRYVLTDSRAAFPGQRPVWQRRPYFLWEVPPGRWAFVTGVRNANGVEEWAGERSFWLGSGETEIRILAARPGPAALVANFARGPSLDPAAPGRLSVLIGQGPGATLSVPAGDSYRLCLSLVAGRNRVVLRPLDPPKAVSRAGGDPRPMLIGMRGLRLRVDDVHGCQTGAPTAVGRRADDGILSMLRSG